MALVSLALIAGACGSPAVAPPVASPPPNPPATSAATTGATATAVPAAAPPAAASARPTPATATATAALPPATPTALATSEPRRPGDSLRPPALPPLVPTATPAPPLPGPASVQPTPGLPGNWQPFTHPSGRWRIQYPADQLKQEDLGDGLTIFISADRTTFVAVDSFVASAAFFGNTGEGMRNRARDALERIYGRAPQQIDIHAPPPPWEAQLTFVTALGSTGQALYEQRGRGLGDYHVLGVVVGYKIAAAATARPFTGAVVGTLTVPHADPFLYCAHAVTATPAGPLGELSGPARYAGPAQPFRSERGGPLTWRCAEGRVLGCEPDATGDTCLRLNVSREPAPALVDHCRRNQDDAAPPPAAAGPGSVYVWACRGGVPVIVRQRIPVEQIDRDGYLIGAWRELARRS